MVNRTVQAAQAAGYDSARFTLIVVDNGSSDHTPEVLAELKDGVFAPWFEVVRIEHNLGYGDGIFKGLCASVAPYVGWTHADEQCDPKDAFDALKRLLEAPDMRIVKGRRHSRKLFDYLWSRVYELVVLLVLRVYLPEINAQPKVFSRELLEVTLSPPKDFSFDLYMLLCARRDGWKIDSIPVYFAPRVHGVSRWAYSFKSRMKTAARIVGYIWALR